MTGLTRRDLLLGSAAALGSAALVRSGARAVVSPTPRKLVLVIAQGGWDTTYALDAKPGSPYVDTPAGTFREFSGLPIYVDPSRPAVQGFFEAYASQCALVNGIQVQSIVHSDCFKRILTGTGSDTNPDFGAITAATHGRALPAPYLVLGQTSFSGRFASLTAKTGTVNQLAMLLDPSSAFPAGDLDNPDVRLRPDATEAALMRDFVFGRADRLRAIRGRLGSNKARLDDFLDSLGRGDALGAIGAAGEPDITRDLRVQVDIALNAFEQEICWVAQLEAGNFDTHSINAQQTQQHQSFYAGLTTLMEELNTRPGSAPGSRMIDETVVVVVSEMGRTPKLNSNQGKDHWPVTSALVLGSGVAGGRVIGSTDDRLGSVGLDLATGAPETDGASLQYASFATGVLSLVGVDPTEHLQAAPLDALQA